MRRILFLLLFPAFVYGQTAQEIVERKLKFTTSQFQTTDISDFVVATAYVKTYAGITGSPFWATDVWNSAEILFKGKTFKVSELKYDCANDLMVIPKYTEKGVILLNLIPAFYPEIFINIKHTGNLRGKMVTEIPINREHFIYYTTSKDEKSEGVSSGYYHYLIEKPLSLLCKYTSSIIDRNGQKAFEEEKKYYLQNKGKILQIRRVSSFLELFPQWKDKINNFVEENNINTLVSLDFEDIEKLIDFTNKLLTQ